MSRRSRPQNLTAKGFKLKKFNEHAYLIKVHTHSHVHLHIYKRVRERERQRERESFSVNTFVVVSVVASHSDAIQHECNHKSWQRNTEQVYWQGCFWHLPWKLVIRVHILPRSYAIKNRNSFAFSVCHWPVQILFDRLLCWTIFNWKWLTGSMTSFSYPFPRSHLSKAFWQFN